MAGPGRIEDPSFAMLFAVVAIGGLIYGYNMVLLRADLFASV